MKIRLAIIDNDENYVRRLVSNFQLNYAERIEPYAFSEYEMFESFFQDNIVHVVLASEKLSAQIQTVPERAAFAWLVSDNAVREWEGHPAVGKYQKAELVYKDVLGLYADIEGKLVLRNASGGRCVLFTSVQGGAGTSVTAAAYALSVGRMGKKVIYLNLDRLGQAELFFQGEGSTGFSDVIYALKTKNGKLPVKLESILRRDSRGVSFFASCKNAAHMLELNADDVDMLLAALNSMEGYDYIVVDMPLDFSDICRTMLEKYAGEVIVINDGSDVGNAKLQKACEVIDALYKKNRSEIFAKSRILYNRYRPGTGSKLTDARMETVGEIPCIEGFTSGQLAERLADHPAIAQLKKGDNNDRR